MRKLLLILALFVLFTNIAISQNVTVEPGGGSYPTLQAAFSAINAGTHTGAITVSIVNNTTETGTCLLNASGFGGANYTSISITPSGGSWTISGAITAGSPLIDLSGADNVTIDGLNTGGNALTISNTTASATSGTSTIRFIDGATNNVITNCTILGSFSAATTTNGGNIYFATDGNTPDGNDNNTISYCNIGPAGSNLPTKGIYGNGSTTTTAKFNSGININNNNIYDYFGAAVSSGGIYAGGGTTDWTISNNKFYQTASRTQTTASQHSAIWITHSSGNNYSITGNTIGFASNSGTGNYTLVGIASSRWIMIFVSVGTTTSTSIQNNTIKAISISGSTSGTSSTAAFRGVYISGGLTNVGDVTGNTIGDMTSTGSISYTSSSTNTSDVMGISNFGSSNWTVNNNNIGGITAANSSTGASNIYGIRVNTGSSVTFTCNNNTIGGNVANSIQSTSTSSSSLVQGIRNESPIGNISSNIIRNLTAAGGTGTITSASVIGIVVAGTSANHTVSQNTIHTLSNTSGTAATTICGIQYNASTGTNLVERNFIHSFNGGNANAILNGINVSGGTTTYKNNMIRLGIDASGNSITTGMAINGISEPLGTDNFYFNSVYVGGTGVGGASATYAFNSQQTVNTRAFQNNIFWNARSNGAGTGKHYAVRVGGTTPNPTGLTINYNLYYASGTGAVFGFFNSLDVANLAAWQTAVGQDANSISGYDPQYINPTGTSSTVDLHIHATNPTVIEGAGLLIGSVTDDFDGQTRSGLTPTDIGADAGNFVAQDVSGPTISYTPLGNYPISSDQVLTATITDATGVPTSGSGLPVLYYKVNAGAYTSVTGVSIGSNQYTFTFGASASNAGDIVSYYIVAQDLAGTPNVSCSPSGGASGFSIDPPAVSTPPTTPSTYTALGTISGTFEVGDDQTTLKKLTNVVTFINSSILTGNVTFELNSTYDGTTGETFPIVLPQFSQSGGWFYITIMPKSGAGARTTSGSSASSVIQFSNADRYILDGREGGTGSTPAWTITNTNTAANTAAIHLLGSTNGSVRNTIRYCNISCNAPQNTSTNITFGIIIGGSTLSISSPGLDNDSTTISNNVITKARYGIFMNGALSTNPDQDVTISGNTIGPASFGADEIGRGGIVALKQTRLNVTQNEIRYVGGDFANNFGSGDRVGIAFATDATWTPTNTFVTNSKITRNKIHHIVEERTFSAAGIVLGCVDGANNTNNEVSNNLIYQISANGTSPDYGVGIGLAAGQNDLIAYNSIYLTGDTDPNASATTPTQSSFCMVLQATFTNPTIVNNIGFMDLTSSSAPTLKNACIGLVTGYNLGTGILNYNNWYYNTGNTQSNTGNIGLQTSPTWYLKLFGSGSWYEFVQPSERYSTQGNPGFVSTTDLSIDATSPNAWNVSGRGVQVPAVTIDYTGATRSTTVGNGSTDLGAYNVTPSSTPPTATASALPAPSTTTTYASGGRDIVSITWGAGGTVPSSIDVVYYPGTNPPNSSGFQVGNGYWLVTATGGSGFTYDITFTYDEAQLGGISSENDIRLTKSEDGTNYTTYTDPGIGPGQYQLSTVSNTITVQGLNSFSYFGITDNDAPLPVQLASFNASVDKRNVNLKWSTSTETNNKGFEIERKEIAGNWSKIGYVEGNGNSTTVKNYSFEDRNLTTGKYNYRLKQIDNNGNYEYHTLSKVVEVGIPTKFDLSQNYPNPFNPVTKIDFALPLDAKVSIKIYDMTGREVKTIVNEQRTAGYYTVQFNGSDLSSGVYFYRIMTKSSGADYIMTKKMVLVK